MKSRKYRKKRILVFLLIFSMALGVIMPGSFTWAESLNQEGSATSAPDPVDEEMEQAPEKLEEVSGEEASKEGRETNVLAPVLAEQEISATLYRDSTLQEPVTAYSDVSPGEKGQQAPVSGTEISVKGLLPEGAIVRAYPVEVESSDDGVVLSAYDITIYDAQGTEFQPQDGNPVQVTISNEVISKAEDVSVYHMKDEYSAQEEVTSVSKEGEQVTFETPSFSVFVVEAKGTDVQVDSHPKLTVKFYDAGGNELVKSRRVYTNKEKYETPPTPEQTSGRSQFFAWSKYLPGQAIPYDDSIQYVAGNPIPAISADTTEKYIARYKAKATEHIVPGHDAKIVYHANLEGYTGEAVITEEYGQRSTVALRGSLFNPVNSSQKDTILGFVCWSTKAEPQGTPKAQQGTRYYKDAGVTLDGSTLNANNELHLYAVWSYKRVTFLNYQNFRKNDDKWATLHTAYLYGTFADANASVPNKPYSISQPDPTREGYVFKGWWKAADPVDSNGNYISNPNALLQNGDTLEIDPYGASNDLYAVWNPTLQVEIRDEGNMAESVPDLKAQYSIDGGAWQDYGNAVEIPVGASVAVRLVNTSGKVLEDYTTTVTAEQLPGDEGKDKKPGDETATGSTSNPVDAGYSETSFYVSKTVTFTNEKSIVPPTGLFSNTQPMLLLFALGLGGFVVIRYTHLKKEETSF